MAFRLYKSQEGIAEYQKVGQPYPETIQDQIYEHHQKLVASDQNKREIVNSIRRIKRYDGSEFIVFSETSEGRDRLYNRKHSFYREDLGKYIALEVETTRIPNQEVMNNPTSTLEFDLNDRPKDISKTELFREERTIVGEKEAYSIPFTKKNMDELHKKADKTCSLVVAKENGTSISVTGSYEQFRDGPFDVLFNYGCIPTKEERERMDNIANRPRMMVSPAATTTAAANQQVMEAIV